MNLRNCLILWRRFFNVPNLGFVVAFLKFCCKIVNYLVTMNTCCLVNIPPFFCHVSFEKFLWCHFYPCLFVHAFVLISSKDSKSTITHDWTFCFGSLSPKTKIIEASKLWVIFLDPKNISHLIFLMWFLNMQLVLSFLSNFVFSMMLIIRAKSHMQSH
jgi:hypothetical protein